MTQPQPSRWKGVSKTKLIERACNAEIEVMKLRGSVRRLELELREAHDILDHHEPGGPIRCWQCGPPDRDCPTLAVEGFCATLHAEQAAYDAGARITSRRRDQYLADIQVIRVERDRYRAALADVWAEMKFGAAVLPDRLDKMLARHGIDPAELEGASDE